MSRPESAPQVPACDVVMSRLRYEPAELRRLKEPEWYRLYDRSVLSEETLEMDETLRHELLQQQSDIEQGAPRITVPYAFTDGRYSHSIQTVRFAFRIPGRLSLDEEVSPANASMGARRTAAANHFVRLRKKRQAQGYDD